MRQLLYAQSERYPRLSIPAARQDHNVAAKHKALMEAVLARNADHARALLTKHLNLTAALLTDIEAPQPPTLRGSRLIVAIAKAKPVCRPQSD